MTEELVSAPVADVSTQAEAAPEAPVRDNTPAKKAFDEIMAIAGGEDEVPEAKPEPKKDVAEEKEAESSDSEPAPSKEANAAAPKILKAKKGDADVEISDDAVFTVKVNKKEEPVSLKELIRNYQGKVPWEKHYQQTIELERSVKQRELEVASQVSRLQKGQEAAQKNFKEIVELARTNPSEALMRACIKAGQSPTEVLRAVIEQSKATVATLERLSPEQVEVLIEKQGIKFDQEVLKTQREAGEMTKKEQGEMTQLETHIGSRCQQHLITAQEYQSSQELLQSAVQAGAVKIDGMSTQKIADLIIDNVLQYDRPRGRIRSVLSEIDPSLAADFKTIAELHDHLGGGDLTKYSDADLNEIMKGVFGSNGASGTEEPVQAVESDSSRERRQPTSPKTPQKQTKPRMEVGDEDDDPLSMEDIKRSYRRMAQ